MQQRTKWLVIVLIGSVWFLNACSSLQKESPTISPYTFTDQHGEAFGSDDLEGRMWVANFIFTECDTVCPPMTTKMADLQEALQEEQLDVELVSFSVDPQVDTAEKLKSYLLQFTNDDSNWHMLNGYSQQEIEQFAVDEFQTLVNKPQDSTQVLHGVNFYVINENGVVIDDFSFSDPELVDKILQSLNK